jgi:hypothetical protein
VTLTEGQCDCVVGVFRRSVLDFFESKAGSFGHSSADAPMSLKSVPSRVGFAMRTFLPSARHLRAATRAASWPVRVPVGPRKSWSDAIITRLTSGGSITPRAKFGSSAFLVQRVLYSDGESMREGDSATCKLVGHPCNLFLRSSRAISSRVASSLKEAASSSMPSQDAEQQDVRCVVGSRTAYIAGIDGRYLIYPGKAAA